RADPRCSAELAAAPGAPHLRGALPALRGATCGALDANVAVVGADALGQRKRRRLDSPQLAAHPLCAADDRLCGRARAGAPSSHGSQPALLGRGSLGGPGLRAPARRLEGRTAAGVRLRGSTRRHAMLLNRSRLMAFIATSKPEEARRFY